MRVACGIEYDGTAYNGWQRQPHNVSIQEKLEAALSFVADQQISLTCAGRTDAGVHATWQVAHFDASCKRDVRSWVFGANSRLPNDIRLLWAMNVDASFHARFSARARRYRYAILNQPLRSALYRDRLAWAFRPLDEELMAAGASYLLGEHDFSTFRAAACQARNPVRTVYRLDVKREGNCIYIDIEANAFLHHMVRNIAGVLISIGSGHRPPEWVRELLACRDRTESGVTAPAQGLYLVGVRYPIECGIGATGYLPRF